MKLRRLSETDALVAKLAASYRAADAPAAPTPELLAKIESRQPHPLDGLAASTRAFAPAGVKTWILGALGAVVLSGVMIVATTKQHASPSPQGPIPSAVDTASGRVTDARQTPPSFDVESLPTVPAVPPALATTQAVAAPPPHATSRPENQKPKTSSLRRELELIEAARRTLRGGDGSACLSAVERYEREFPSGQFSREGHVMQIEALALVGRQGESIRLSRAFLEAHPTSPYAERVRSVLTRLEAP